MFKSILHRFVAAALSVLLPAAVLSADAGSAMLTAGNDVQINGKKAMNRQAVLPGDSIKNNGVAEAVLSMPAGSVAVAKHSSVIYQNGEVQVLSGAATFNVTDTKAQYEEVSVRASAKTARFLVGEVNGKRMVAALHGSLVVSDGVHEVVLPEGTAMTQDRVPEPAAKGKGVGNDTNKTAKQDEQRGGKRRAAGALPGWMSVVLIGGAVGGVLGGLAAGGYFDKQPVSGSNP